MGYVYLLEEINNIGKNRYKIGITKSDVQKRVKQLSTGNSKKIQLLNSYETKNYHKVEQWLHKRFDSKQTESENEWFFLEKEDIENFIDTCKKIDETVNLLLKENYFFK